MTSDDGTPVERVTQSLDLTPSERELSRRSGLTEESIALVDARVEDGQLVATVHGIPNPQETGHRLPDELLIRRCDDCDEEYGSAVRECPSCGSTNTEFDIDG